MTVGGRPANAEDLRLATVLTDFAFTELSTASERMHEIRTKLLELGAPLESIDAEVRRARQVWRGRVGEPTTDPSPRLDVATTRGESKATYREPQKASTRSRIRTKVSQNAKRNLGRWAIVLIAAPFLLHALAKDPSGLWMVDVFCVLLLLLFAWELASGITVDIEGDVVAVRERFLIRTSTTKLIRRSAIQHIRLVEVPADGNQQPLVRLEIVENDGSVHLIRNYMDAPTAKSLVAEIEAAVFDSIRRTQTRVRVKSDEDVVVETGEEAAAERKA